MKTLDVRYLAVWIVAAALALPFSVHAQGETTIDVPQGL